ncbi:DUF305 domain-containing protein [Candidatus Falkowbacteria bacterium HGW-Falkowbacteria-2]|uniref:DUF305 domain-containing protein n=1 Tax=Candidatus Falkowbacteria bacterium HGW-Falkowbacteria-2 TaxID=2013769 RepID=A0A2N2DY41_9BACT|nr:MAG: DUF305 domain-containing protein [Candidatus Falkowbacteria bacterium HGW-Falkowbacteria-2]
MKKISLYLALSLAVVAVMIGIVIGYSITPDYQARMYDKNGMDLGESDYFLDRRYLNAMITHHRSAIGLAEQATERSSRQEIKDLAAMIQENEPKLIDELYEFKREWYSDRRQAPAPTVPNLGEEGETFDLRFLNALIAHHEEGIEMAMEIKTKTSRGAVIDNADAVMDFLTTSKDQLLEWRQDWYNL